jgi:hypothetical protein
MQVPMFSRSFRPSIARPVISRRPSVREEEPEDPVQGRRAAVRRGWAGSLPQPQPIPGGMRPAALRGLGEFTAGNVAHMAIVAGGAYLGYRMGVKHKLLMAIGGAFAAGLIANLAGVAQTIG